MFRQPLTVLLQQGLVPDAGCRRLVPRGESFEFEIRAITRREFQDWQALARGQVAAFEDTLIREAVLVHPPLFRNQPWDWDHVYAGLVSRVADAILQLSGFGDGPDPGVVTRAQAYLQDPGTRYDLLILTAFDGYKLEDLLDMDPEIWHRVVGLAVMKLTALGLDPDALLDPEAARKKKKRQPPPMPDMGGGRGPRGASAGGRRVEHRQEVEGAFSFS